MARHKDRAPAGALDRRDIEYRTLLAQHRDFEARLLELTGRRFLTASERLESANIKKLKLRLKDRMAALDRGDSLPQH